MDSDAKKPRKGDSKAANQDILRVGEQVSHFVCLDVSNIFV